ncbi:hypothetical protein BH10BDE1_BH10BDE1_25460 [soil metagenome]
MNSNLLRKILIRMSILVASSILGLFAVEFATRVMIVPDRLGLQPSLAFRVNTNAANTMLRTNLDTDCTWLENYSPSFRFGYTYRTSGECSIPGVDINGFMNRNPFPRARSSEVFSILVLGGSVAEAISDSQNAESSLLEHEFRTKYLGPMGQRIDVYSGALGGWAVPNQELVLMTFIQGFDAVIVYDGANELTRLKNAGAIGRPDPVNFSFRYDHSRLFDFEFAIVKLMRRLRHFGPLSRSYAWAGLQSLIETSAQDELFTKIGGESNIGHYADLPAPPSQTEIEIVDENIQRYIRSVKNIFAMSKANGSLAIHFIQPIAGIAKPLTEAEKPFANYEGKEYYRRLESETLTALQGQESYSLIDLFKNESKTIYADRVHAGYFDGQSPGYTAMSDAIVKRASKSWHLKPVTAN